MAAVPFLLLLFLVVPDEANSRTATVGNGLEAENHQTVEIVVEDLDKAAGDIGLTVDRLRTKVELRLRQAGLRPGKRGGGEYLYAKVNVVGSGFSIRIEFRREVRYFDPAGRPKWVDASTWDTGATGTHAGDSEYIVQWVDRLLDKFLNEYLKANGQ